MVQVFLLFLTNCMDFIPWLGEQDKRGGCWRRRQYARTGICVGQVLASAASVHAFSHRGTMYLRRDIQFVTNSYASVTK